MNYVKFPNNIYIKVSKHIISESLLLPSSNVIVKFKNINDVEWCYNHITKEENFQNVFELFGYLVKHTETNGIKFNIVSY